MLSLVGRGEETIDPYAAQVLAKPSIDLDMSFPKPSFDVLAGREVEVLEYDILTLGSIPRPLLDRFGIVAVIILLRDEVVYVSKGRILLCQCGLEFFLRTLCKPAVPDELLGAVGGDLIYGCTYFHACSFGEAITSSRGRYHLATPRSTSWSNVRAQNQRTNASLAIHRQSGSTRN